MPNRDPQSVNRARQLRSEPTPAEKALWQVLRAQTDVHWRRQAPIGSAIADFACLRAKLIVEVDGGAHDHPAAKLRDQERTAQLESHGHTVVRFSNEEVLHDPAKVAAQLRTLALSRLPTSAPGRSAGPPPPAPPPTKSEKGRPSRRSTYIFDDKHPAASTAPKDLVLVGAIASAFGVRGEVRVRSFTAAFDGVVSYGPLFDAEGRIVMTPKRWREIKDGLAVTAPEIKDRDAAEALKGTALHVPRSVLPPAEEDEFYHVDLIGCRVETLAGEPVGEVIAVQDFGAGDLLEVRSAGGKTLFVAFTREAAPHVDIAGRRIVIAPMSPEDDAA
ncbi:MAG: 16S rRNA processing protein RimM [Hyphomonadaceae bacterium]|nr:16S rRNA processing protein RimM [Hyphomonadaceae bacterium]